MEFSWLLHGFVKIDTKISLSCHMDLSKLLHGFALVVTRICPTVSVYFSPFAKQNQAEVWPGFQSLFKILLLTLGVEWVKVLNALGSLCLWQCSSNNRQKRGPAQCPLIYISGIYDDLFLSNRENFTGCKCNIFKGMCVIRGIHPYNLIFDELSQHQGIMRKWKRTTD